MPYKTKIGDITKQKVDAIVNSLGVNGTVYGSICDSIITSSKSKELKSFIDSKLDNPIGDIYITEGYNLPCSNIMHLVTPFRHQDNDKCDLLKRNVRKVIDKAIELNYKSIAIPFIGIGYNGYTKEEVYKVLTNVCADIDNMESKIGHNIINILVIIYFGHKKYDRLLQLKKLEMQIDNCNLSKSIYNDAMQYQTTTAMREDEYENSEILSCIKAIGDINPKHFFNAHYENYKRPYDFVIEYMNYYHYNEIECFNDEIDRKRRYQLKHQRSIKKKEAFLIGFAFNFSKTVMNEFLIICGLSYTPGNDLDDFFRLYFDGELGDYESFYNLKKGYYDFCGGVLEF